MKLNFPTSSQTEQSNNWDNIDNLSTNVSYAAAVNLLGQKALSGIDLSYLFQDTVALVSQILNIKYSRIWQVLSDGNSLRKVASLGESSLTTDAYEIHVGINQGLKKSWTRGKKLLISIQPLVR